REPAMSTGVSSAVDLAAGRGQAQAAWRRQAGVDATLQPTRRRGALDRGGPASSVPEPGAGGRGSKTPTATAPRQAGPARPPATRICLGLTTATPARGTGPPPPPPARPRRPRGPLPSRPPAPRQPPRPRNPSRPDEPAPIRRDRRRTGDAR